METLTRPRVRFSSIAIGCAGLIGGFLSGVKALGKAEVYMGQKYIVQQAEADCRAAAGEI